ncbi:MAG: hypothetical protein ACLPVY_24725 [Acidimicrobiia bacterium]
MTLNVMVLENEPNVAARAEQELRDAGHTVLLCHEPDRAAFPCRGITRPSECPLHSHLVDVALVVRTGTTAQPTLGEDGARCALIHRIPLVVAGAAVFDPFDNYATQTIDRTADVVEACEQAAAAPIDDLGRRATEVLDEIVGETTARHEAPHAVVTRRAGRLHARVLNSGTLTRPERARAAVRITMALRELDPYASGIDVAIAAATAGER